MNPDSLEKRIKYSVRVLIVFLVVTPVIYLIWFGIINKTPISSTAEAWGQFGDYLGGILNPLFSLVAVYWLVNSVRLQKTELEETRKALIESKDSQIEQAKTLYNTSQLTALSSLLNSTNSEIQNLRQNIEFMCSQLGNGTVFDLNGQTISQLACQQIVREIRENLGALIEKKVDLETKISELVFPIEPS